jgi:hypothetical protein
MHDPFEAYNTLAQALQKTRADVDSMTAHLSNLERERALYALVSAWSLALEMWVFKADPAEPAFTDWMAHGRKTAGDSPYTVYLTTPVRAEHTYSLRGNLGDATYFGLQVYRQVQGFNTPSGRLVQDEFVVDAQGNFEIHLAKERPANATNWVPLGDDDYLIMTREYRYDPAAQRAVTLTIARTDTNPARPIPLAERVEKAARYFTSIILSTIEIADLLSVNEFSPPAAEVRTPQYGDSLFPNTETYYDGFFVRLQPGEAIEMHGRLPDVWRYVSFVFYDRWYATLDYPQTRCYLTAKDLHFNPDGTYTIYLSAEDPNHPNWIQMGALREGLYSYRYIMADSNPKPTVRVVNLQDIGRAYDAVVDPSYRAGSAVQCQMHSPV